MVAEEDFLEPEEEEDLEEAARRIRLGGLEVGILYNGNGVYEDVYDYGGAFACKV